MRAFAAAFGLALPFFFLAAPARAFERQQHLGLDASAAMMTTSSTKLGIDLGLHYAYGLSDAFNLVAEAGWSGFTSSGVTGPQPSTIAHGGVGLLYVFDVLRWVPYAGALMGAAYLGGGRVEPSFVTPNLTLEAGLDYAITRDWAIGGAYRQQILVARTSDYGYYASLGLRVEYVWGW